MACGFIRQAVQRGQRLTRLPNPGIFVYVRHGGNAWQFEPGQFLDPAAWQQVAPPPGVPADLLDRYRAALAAPAALAGAPH